MRLAGVIAILLTVATSRAARILLIPLDSRPASGQFAQMIGQIAGVDVRMPPYEALGRFTTPGDPERILRWLNQQDLSDVRAIIASTDMIAYGGLIASRVNDVDEEHARERLGKLLQIRRRAPLTKLYLFSATMRLAPTATKAAAPWRMLLATYKENEDRARRFDDPDSQAALLRIGPRIPPGELEVYDATRQRDHRIQVAILKTMSVRHDIDYLIVGQDDARPFGPHVAEVLELRKLSRSLGLKSRVYFCEGVDQDANVLMSRALLDETGWSPRVHVVYSDPAARSKIAAFEGVTIAQSVSEQLAASGARAASADVGADYTLYINTPSPNPERFDRFLMGLQNALDEGQPVSVADINLGDSSPDPRLIDGLLEDRRAMRLLSFAGWNTAGNSIGTAIPAANVYLLAKRSFVDPLRREVAKQAFLLHRFVNDYDYHRFTRPKAFALMNELKTSADEVYGENYDLTNAFVRRDMSNYLQQTFESQLLGQTFQAGDAEYSFTGLSDVRIFLPWPRAYEVRMEFHLDTASSP